MSRRRWIQIDGKLVEVKASITVSEAAKRKPKGPAIMADTMKPYWNANVGKWVASRSEHKRILRENNLIELGNEKDAWIKQVENPDFTSDGRPLWRDPLSEADDRIVQENTEWIAKNTGKS